MNGLVFIGDLAPFKEQRDNKRKRQYERLIAQADRYESYILPDIHPQESTTYMGIAIMNLALAYRLSENEKYLAEAKRFMRAVLSYEQWGNAHLVNVDLSASWILYGLSLGYDWLKPHLSGAEQQEVADKIRHHAEIMYDYKVATYGRGWSTDYYQNHNWINMTGLAAAGYALGSDDEDAGKYTEESKRNFERVFSLLAEDGSNYEGVPYWRYGGMWLFVYAHLLKVQEGIDYFGTSDYLKNTFYYRLYQSCGDLEQQLNFGDSHDRHSGHTACIYYKAAAEYGDGFAQTFGNLVLDEFLMVEAAESKIKPGILPEAAFEYLWYAPEVAEQDLALLPKVRYFEDLGLLAIRESWNRDSKVLTIKCGYPGGRKQWKNGWRMYREEGIECLSLSHHHPDNLSYIFASGSEFLTCEDGYNRNLMPDNHNVLLVDGRYTDAADVNDVYVSSARMRLEKDPAYPIEDRYYGAVTYYQEDDGVVIYKGETSGVYPEELRMREVSRLLFTDRLSFFLFIDVCDSETEHTYQVISNTDMAARKLAENCWQYPMNSGNVTYTVYSDHETRARQYTQEVVSVMTTQEPDKVCKTSINTLAVESAAAVKRQMFIQCFTFDHEETALAFADGELSVECRGRRYLFARSAETERLTIRIYDENGDNKNYEICE